MKQYNTFSDDNTDFRREQQFRKSGKEEINETELMNYN